VAVENPAFAAAPRGAFFDEHGILAMRHAARKQAHR
jgi:hypothetical protein